MVNDIVTLYEDYAKTEDFSEMNQLIIQEIGIKNFFKLLKIVGGIHLYLPVHEKALVKARERIICEEFDGYNFNKLAQKHKISEVWVRQIVSKKAK